MRRIRKDQEDLLKRFYQLVADIEDPEEAKEILGELFAQSELEVVAKKLAVAKDLREGESYNHIRAKYQVSSATISQVQQAIKKQKGILLALDKVVTDEWANKWEEKIKKLFGKI
jgi:TrpR-related protein YerC/YecD